jgi:hypothetical protein
MKEHLGLNDTDDKVLDDPTSDEFFHNIWNSSA